MIGGADVMCPGLISPGAKMDESVGANSSVAIYGEGKELPFAIGVTTMSPQEILETKKGQAVVNYHFIGDRLWHLKSLK